MTVILLDHMASALESNQSKVGRTKHVQQNISQMKSIHNWISSFKNKFELNYANQSTSDVVPRDGEDIKYVTSYANNFSNFKTGGKLRCFSPEIINPSQNLKLRRELNSMSNRNFSEDDKMLSITSMSPVSTYVMRMK